MTGSDMREPSALEGRRVNVALRNGNRLDDVQLVSANGGRVRSLWLFTNGADMFIPVEDVMEVWEAPLPKRSVAA
jgi:hypothetical protein